MTMANKASDPAASACARPGPLRFHPRHRRRPRRRAEVSANPHPLSARAQRLPAHRPRQVHLPELRHRPRVRRRLQPAHGRHQPDQGGRRVCGFHHRGRELAHRRLGRRPARAQAQGQDAGSADRSTASRTSTWRRSLATPELATPRPRLEPFYASRLLRPDLRVRPAAHPERARPTSATSRPRTPTNIAARPTAPARKARSATAPSRRTSTSSPG